MIRLGYVGINTTLQTPNKTFRLSNYTEEKMLLISKANLEALKQIFLWNKENNISFFRITSSLIPFGSHPINSGIWKNELAENFYEIGEIIKANNFRVSMHPGQYTVLNSPTQNIYENALIDLQYHTDILDLMKLDKSNRIVIHGGGAYGDKEKSLNTLVERIKEVPLNIYNRLMLENDDYIFNAEEILETCFKTNVPGVFDVFHHEVFKSLEEKSIKELILLYKETWSKDERQKIHYSNQDSQKPKGAHSFSIDTKQFKELYDQIKELDLDIMLEVKDKQESVLNVKRHFPELY